MHIQFVKCGSSIFIAFRGWFEVLARLCWKVWIWKLNELRHFSSVRIKILKCMEIRESNMTNCRKWNTLVNAQQLVFIDGKEKKSYFRINNKAVMTFLSRKNAVIVPFCSLWWQKGTARCQFLLAISLIVNIELDFSDLPLAQKRYPWQLLSSNLEG